MMLLLVDLWRDGSISEDKSSECLTLIPTVAFTGTLLTVIDETLY